MNIVREKAISLLKKGRINEVFMILHDTVNPMSPLYNEVIASYRRFKELEKHQLLGTVHQEFIQTEKNRIIHSLIRIVEELDSKDYESNINVTLKSENKRILINENNDIKIISKRLSFWEWIKKIFNKIFQH